MKESSEHLLALVNSLLDFYRLDINKVDVDKVAFCPAQLFETIRAGFAAQARGEGHRADARRRTGGRARGGGRSVPYPADRRQPDLQRAEIY